MKASSSADFAREQFWERQGLARLRELTNDRGALTVAPLDLLEQKRAVDAAIGAARLAVEEGWLRLVAAEPGIDAATIASRLGFAARPIGAALELLRSAGVVRAFGEGYAVTDAARVHLSPESPFFDPVIYQACFAPEHLRALREDAASEVVREWGRGRALDPEATAMVMHRRSFPFGFALAANGVEVGQRVLDVGGGAGSVSIGLALSLPQVKCTVLELPGSVEVAARLISAYELTDRIHCVAADMFADGWSTGFDTVIFSNVLHDWDSARCATLANKAFGALSESGSVVVLEALMSEAVPSPLWTSHLSFGMALEMAGRQFTAREIIGLLERAGFDQVVVKPLLGHYSSVLGRRRTRA